MQISNGLYDVTKYNMAAKFGGKVEKIPLTPPPHPNTYLIPIPTHSQAHADPHLTLALIPKPVQMSNMKQTDSFLQTAFLKFEFGANDHVDQSYCSVGLSAKGNQKASNYDRTSW